MDEIRRYESNVNNVRSVQSLEFSYHVIHTTGYNFRRKLRIGLRSESFGLTREDMINVRK